MTNSSNQTKHNTSLQSRGSTYSAALHTHHKLSHEYHVFRFPFSFIFIFCPFLCFLFATFPAHPTWSTQKPRLDLELQRVLPSSFTSTSRRIWTPLTTDLSPFARPHAQIHIPTTQPKRDHRLDEWRMDANITHSEM